MQIVLAAIIAAVIALPGIADAKCRLTPEQRSFCRDNWGHLPRQEMKQNCWDYFCSQPPDTESPTIPTGVSANASNTTRIFISWNASTDNVGVTGYDVYRNGDFLDTTSALTYADEGLQPNTSYIYEVLAFDEAGNKSNRSEPSSATTDPDQTSSKSENVLPADFSGPLSDAEALSHVMSSNESRQANAQANRTYPTNRQLKRYRREVKTIWTGIEDPSYGYIDLVTGRPGRRLTTDEIIQWAAWKWGLDEDMLRAQAVYESDWLQSAAGDFTSNTNWCPSNPTWKNGECAQSYGLYQIKVRYCSLSAWPIQQSSTAFNADYLGMITRITWNGDVTFMDDGRNEPGTNPYGSTGPEDVWAAVGAWYSGFWNDAPALNYIAQIKQELVNRDWHNY